MSIFFRIAWLRRLGALAALLGLAVAQAGAAPAPLPADEVQEAATEAYIYAYPLVLMEMTRRVATNVAAAGKGIAAPVNQFAHVPTFPDAKFDAVVRPNADTLYSSLWYDVSREPLIISTPDSGGRYFLLPVLDLWTDVFTVPGTRTTGNGAQSFAIVGPHWHGKLPAGVTAYVSPTATGWVLGRTQTNGAADFAAVRKFQAGIKAVPLSAVGKAYTPPAGKHNPAQDMSAPVEQVAKMDAASFFSLFAQLLRDNPPHAQDYPVVDRLARIGLVPGKTFDVAALSPEWQAALKAAPMLAQMKIGLAVRRAGALVNGWRMLLNPIGTYGTDYTRRAAIAYAGLGANSVEDAIYPAALVDAEGKPFDSGARYVLHFDKAQLPPARAFWSLTMYNERQFFAANPIDRFAIGDRDALKYNADGSLDLLVQRDAPDADKASNWLPAPASGSFTLMLRLYWPKPAALDGGWAPPAIRRIN